MSARGRFITLEGGEGAGKSTQARHLADWLERQGIAVLTTREPGGSPAAEALRRLLLGGRVAPFGPEAEALVFAIARADHLAETIRPALQAGRWVICDRFHDSTWAYQGAAGVSPAHLEHLDSVAVGGDRPDLTVILDVPPEVGLQRLRGRDGAPDRFEAEAIGHHRARREAYLQIAAREPDRCRVVDASAEPDRVAKAICTEVAGRFGPLLGSAS